MDLPAPSQEDLADQRHDSHRDHVHRGLVVTIFTAVELDRLKSKQQKADVVEKLGLMVSKEISNSQLELIRLTGEVVGSLDKYWSNIDTIQHVLLVCDVAERQVSVIELVMQAAMGGHVSVTDNSQTSPSCLTPG
jgi:hypothetical protein